LEQSMEKWNSNFGNVKIREEKGGDVKKNLTESGQLNFQF